MFCPGSPPVSPTLARALAADDDRHDDDDDHIRHGIELDSTRARAAHLVSTVATVADTLKRTKDAADAQVHRLASRVEQAQQVAHEHERITARYVAFVDPFVRCNVPIF